MFRYLFSLVAVATLTLLPHLVKANDFAGANSYYLYAVSVRDGLVLQFYDTNVSPSSCRTLTGWLFWTP